MTHATPATVLATVIAFAACGATPATQSRQLRGTTALPGLGANEVTVETIDVARCAGSADVRAALAIVEDFRVSAREMVVCGGIYSRFVGAVVEAAIRSVHGSPAKSPLQWSGEGRYRAGGTPGSVAMEVQVFGAGGPIGHDLLAAQSYFVDARVEPAPGGDGVAIHHAGTGPLVELLGFGAAPTSPLVVKAAELSRADDGFRALEIEGTIEVPDVQGQTAVAYTLVIPRRTLGEARDARDAEMAFRAGRVARADLGQQLVVDAWSVRSVDGAKGLRGRIAFHAEGGPFAFQGAFVYEGGPEPRIEVTCR